MSTPLTILVPILPRNFPIEILNIIQLFVRNDSAHQAVKEYMNYLFYKNDLYQDFAYQTYIIPNCYCSPYTLRSRECCHCYYFDYTDAYMPQEYRCCIKDNPQFIKILCGLKGTHTDYNEESSCSYDYHYGQV